MKTVIVLHIIVIFELAYLAEPVAFMAAADFVLGFMDTMDLVVRQAFNI